MKMFIVSLLVVLVSGCSSTPNYGQYREKVMLCESMNMTVHVVNGIKNNIPYVKEVVCYDKYGASWNAERMND